jgi:hypothetical protein
VSSAQPASCAGLQCVCACAKCACVLALAGRGASTTLRVADTPRSARPVSSAGLRSPARGACNTHRQRNWQGPLGTRSAPHGRLRAERSLGALAPFRATQQGNCGRSTRSPKRKGGKRTRCTGAIRHAGPLLSVLHAQVRAMLVEGGAWNAGAV